MADRHVAREGAQLLLVEHLRDEAEVAHGHDVAALAGGDARRLLSAVLERVEREVGEARDVHLRRVDAEDAAFVARSVTMVELAAHAFVDGTSGQGECAGVCQRRGNGALVRSRQLSDGHRQRRLRSRGSRPPTEPITEAPRHGLEGLARPRKQHAARALAEERRLGRSPSSDARADAAGDAALGQRTGKAALDDVVRGDQPRRRGSRRATRSGRRRWRCRSSSGSSLDSAAAQLLQLRALQRGLERADQGDRVPLLGEGDAGRTARDRAACPPSRRSAWGRSAPRRPRCRATRCRPRRARRAPAGVAQGRATARVELPGDVRLLGVAEVEAVGEPERLGADAGQVARRTRAPPRPRPAYGSQATRRPLPSIDTAIAPRAAIGLEREHRGVGGLRAPHRARADDRVVLLEHEALGGDRSASRAAPAASRPRTPRGRARAAVRVDGLVRLLRLEVVERAVVHERLDRHVAHERVAVEHAQPARVGDLADRAWRAPPSARRPPSPRPARPGSTTHSIRSCDSEIITSNGSMSASRSGTSETSMSMPTSPFDAISDELDDSPAAPRSCSERSAPRSSSSRQHSSSFFSSNGSPICTVGRLLVALVELRAGEHRGAADAVAAGARAEQHQLVADAGRGAADQPLRGRDAEAHRVDQAVVLVRPLEVDLAADGRHADRVAVVADAADGAVEQVARARRVELAEAQRVEHRDRAARRPRRRRAGCRRPRWPRPGTARPRSGGCATRP